MSTYGSPTRSQSRRAWSLASVPEGALIFGNHLITTKHNKIMTTEQRKNFFLSLVGMEMSAAIKQLGYWWCVTKSERGYHTLNRSAGGFLEVRTELINGREIITHETHNKLAEIYANN